jgi:transcriptional regulator with XRE-family HTH domain
MRYNFSAAIRDARRRKGLSQEALARASGTSRITIARLEAGSEQDFRLGTLRSLCETLDLDLLAQPRGRKHGPAGDMDARRRHAALAAALLAVKPDDAVAMIGQARANVDAWEREGKAGGPHIKAWRSRLEGPARTVALRLLEHNQETAALLANSPWAFALEPEAA